MCTVVSLNPIGQCGEAPHLEKSTSLLLFHPSTIPLSSMKRRITFVQRQDAPFKADQAVLSAESLSIRDLDAAREDRITFGLEDLPAEVRDTAHRFWSQ